MTDHGSLYQGWRDDPLGDGGGQAPGIAWETPWSEVFEGPAVRTVAGFPGGRLNTSYNCLDRHVDGGAGDRPALVWDSAMTGEVVTHTYRELRDRVAKLAGAIAAVGAIRWSSTDGPGSGDRDAGVRQTRRCSLEDPSSHPA